MPNLDIKEKLEEMKFTDKQIKNAMKIVNQPDKEKDNNNDNENKLNISSSESSEDNYSEESGIDHEKIINKEDIKIKQNSESNKDVLQQGDSNNNKNEINPDINNVNLDFIENPLNNVQKVANHTKGFVND